jgi:hypothetical protein
MNHSQTVETRRRKKRALKVRAAAARQAKKLKNRNAKTAGAH